MVNMSITSPLWFIGVVENNVDERLEGRVQVRAFDIHGNNTQIPTENLPWATLIIGSYDTNFVVPPVNSWVFGFFVDGRDAQQPMILGLIPNQLTSVPNPVTDGYGAIPPSNAELLSQGSRPSDFGQPMISRLARGEDVNNTYVLAMETNRVQNVSSAGGAEEHQWSEPATAYAAEYPFNRVIETPGGHSVELDDTPGAERVMIYHKTGSYVQMDAKGTTTIKSMDDKYDINETNNHVYVGGTNKVTIEGDCYMLVKGNKLEEINGDCKQIVHGNYELSVAGQMNLNASDEIRSRAARISMHANIEDVSIKSGKKIRIESGSALHLKSATTINFESLGDLSLKSENVNIQSGSEMNLKGSIIKIGSDGKLSISGSTVAIDDIIRMSSGESDAPSEAIVAETADSVEMMEPAGKLPYTAGYVSSPSGGSAGYSSLDNSSDSLYSEGSAGLDGIDVSYTSNCSSNLVDEVIKYESFRSHAYWDVRQYSVGYGMAATSANQVVTVEEARVALEHRLNRDRNTVKNYGLVHGYNWNDCQLDALTSFVYNLGTGVLGSVTENGTRTNDQIADAMLEYNGTIINGNKTVLQALVSRRNSESAWFRNSTSTNSDSSSGVMV